MSDCNCEQSERLKKELVEMCDLVATIEKVSGSHQCVFNMQILRIKAQEIKARYSK